MKRKVNPSPLVFQKGMINSHLLVSLWTTLIVILVLISGYEYYELMGVKRSLTALDIRRLDTKQRLDKLAKPSRGEAETELLINEIARLEAEAKTKKRVISQLSGHAIGNTAGFSRYLEGFARQIRDGIWIRKINISNGGADLDIYGTTMSAALVPGFLKDLSHEQIFSDTEFKSFIMKRQGDGNEQTSTKIDFTIQTSLPENETTNPGLKKTIERANAVINTPTDTRTAPQTGGNGGGR